MKVHFGRQPARDTTDVNWEKLIGLGRGHAQDGGRKGWAKKTVMLKPEYCPEITVYPNLFPAFVIKNSLHEAGRSAHLQI